MSKWLASHQRADSENYHVLPVDDIKEHNSSGQYCRCQPEIRQESEGTLVIHNAYDGREFFENDEDKEPDFFDLNPDHDFIAWNLDNSPIDILDNP